MKKPFGDGFAVAEGFWSVRLPERRGNTRKMLKYPFTFIKGAGLLFVRISPKLWIFGTGVWAELVLFLFWLMYRKEEKPEKSRMACLALLIFYLVFAFFITTIARKPMDHYGYILKPLGTYKLILGGSRAKLRETVYNYCLAAPLGILLPYILNRRCTWRDILFLSFFFSAAIECTQLIFRLGFFELDDILHNCLGALIGYGLVFLFRWGLRKIGIQN